PPQPGAGPAPRRTSRPRDVEDATRRSVQWGGPPGLPSGPAAPEAGASVVWPHVARARKPPAPVLIIMMRGVAALVVAIVVYIAWSMISGYRLYGRGQDSSARWKPSRSPTWARSGTSGRNFPMA